MKGINTNIGLLMIVLLIAPPVNAQISPGEGMNPCVPCEELLELNLPDVTVTGAERATESNAHCRVNGIIGQEIKFEILLPDTWNSRYIMQGNGGFAGSTPNFAKWRLNQGYAISGTNTGHEGNAVRADWALNNMERQLNFAHLAVHRTAVVSKAIINQYYGQFPDFNYFIGCSNGGKQAMIEAQRYPADFDGIVAGAPAIDFSRFSAMFIRNSQLMFPDPDNFNDALLTKAQLEILQNSVLEQCDEIDGLKDHILNDPRACDFDFSQLPVCTEDQGETACFTKEQLEAIQTIYAGLTIEGEEVYPEFPLGSEMAWWGWIAGPSERSMNNYGFPSNQFGLGTEWFKFFIFNDPEWDYSSYDFSDYFSESEFAHHTFSAASTNYQAFDSLGGKRQSTRQNCSNEKRKQ